MPLEGLGPPFEGPNGIMFRAGFWKGKPVVLRMSSASSTGYENVFQQGGSKKRNRPFVAKFKRVGEKTQRHLPDSNSATAEEAAAKLAYHHEYGSELPPPAARQPRRSPEEMAAERAVKEARKQARRPQRPPLTPAPAQPPQSPLTGPGVPCVPVIPLPMGYHPLPSEPVIPVGPVGEPQPGQCQHSWDPATCALCNWSWGARR